MSFPPISQERLRSMLDYDPETGVFTWKWRADVRANTNSRLVGQVAGCFDIGGYRIIGIEGDQHRAHRLAWFYVHGEWPGPNEIDHINRSRADNRLANLRRVEHPIQQIHNRDTLSHTGRRNIYFRGSSFWVHFQHDGKRARIRFETLEDAVAHRDAIGELLYGSVDEKQAHRDSAPMHTPRVPQPEVRNIVANGGGFAVYVTSGKKYYGGSFKTLSEAIAARDALRAELGIAPVDDAADAAYLASWREARAEKLRRSASP